MTFGSQESGVGCSLLDRTSTPCPLLMFGARSSPAHKEGVRAGAEAGVPLTIIIPRSRLGDWDDRLVIGVRCSTLFYAVKQCGVNRW